MDDSDEKFKFRKIRFGTESVIKNGHAELLDLLHNDYFFLATRLLYK
jgi:hypothetical protein